MNETLEQRVAKLETFMGNIDKITSVYANTIEEICNRWLNILYIEDSSQTAEWREHPNNVYIEGFLTALDSVSDVPHNTIFFIRPSHNITVQDYSDPNEDTKIVFTRENKTLAIGLRKPDPNNRDNLIKLNTGDLLKGHTYLIYINSQNLAVVSTSDEGVQALEIAGQLQTAVTGIQEAIQGMAASQSITNLEATSASIGTLNISVALNLANASSITLPTGSTITGDPTLGSHITNKNYVDTKIWSEIMRYHSTYHLFGVASAQEALSPETVPEGAIYYKYPEE